MVFVLSYDYWLPLAVGRLICWMYWPTQLTVHRHDKVAMETDRQELSNKVRTLYKALYPRRPWSEFTYLLHHQVNFRTYKNLYSPHRCIADNWYLFDNKYSKFIITEVCFVQSSVCMYET